VAGLDTHPPGSPACAWPHTVNVLIVVGVLAVAVPGVLGWFVGEALGGHGEAGIAIVYGIVVLLWALLDEHTGEVTFQAILAFLAGLPVVYVAVVAIKSLALVAGLADPSARDILLSSLLSALLGTGISVGLSLVGAFKQAADPSAGGPRADLEELFLTGLSYRMPLALLIAGLNDLPDAPRARLLTGTAWGVAAAVCVVGYNALVDRKPIRSAWPQVVLIQALILVTGLFAVLESIGEPNLLLDDAAQLAIPASAACAVTYLLVLVGVAAARRLASQRAATAEEATPGDG
jgi:hypothetical protein